jgi:hypothetical protein
LNQTDNLLQIIPYLIRFFLFQGKMVTKKKKKVSKLKTLFSGVSAADVTNLSASVQSGYESVLDNLSKKGQVVAYSTSVTRAATGSATTLIYAVPANKTFYLTNVSLQYSVNLIAVSGTGSCAIAIEGGTAALNVAYLSAGNIIALSNQYITHGFNIPIRVEGGSSIDLDDILTAGAATSTTATAHIIGFLVDKPLI